jgi:protein-tyrosine phosphatase
VSDYQLTWVTEQLAIGQAPMSYADLDAIKGQGVGAILNLCGEYCDLHEIEQGRGFEVFYLPIPDETAPDREEVEKALSWLEETMAGGKRVLVHCRFGKGRTGTLVVSYLLQRGLSLKEAVKAMKGCHCLPTSYSQWRFVKRYQKENNR